MSWHATARWHCPGRGSHHHHRIFVSSPREEGKESLVLSLFILIIAFPLLLLLLRKHMRLPKTQKEEEQEEAEDDDDDDGTGEMMTLSLEAISDHLFLALLPFSLAFLSGLFIGCSCSSRASPPWAGPAPLLLFLSLLLLLLLNSRSRFFLWTLSPSTGLAATRICLALTHLSLFSFLNRFFPNFEPKASPPATLTTSSAVFDALPSHLSFSGAESEQPTVTDADLETFFSYENEEDGGPPWQLMMEKSTASLAFKAWRRDPEIGPTQYRTKTVFENIAPDLLRDFFWDDEFRTTWDNMLIYFKTLLECPHTGTAVVHWIRKKVVFILQFPFFCSDREYIIVRRIWELGSTYYCVTKQNTEHPAVTRCKKPRRVDLYFSSWRIKPVEGRNGGQRMASEVLLFHYEETGIPKEIAKIAIQRGMWGLVKRMDAGMRAYQLARMNGGSLSGYAVRARITTKWPSSSSLLPEPESSNMGLRIQEVKTTRKQKHRKNVLKWLIVGGVLVAFGLNGGVLGKGIAFGIVKCFRRDQKHKKNAEEG
ncbi:hypothetical protein ACLOJK_023891 [Asimina triloba]